MLICRKLNKFLIILGSAVIRVTEMAVELTLGNKFLTITCHHAGFDALTAGSFIATFQEYWLFILQIKEMLAEGALELRIF
jgi:hypothetical protein